MTYFAEIYQGYVRYVGSGSALPPMNPVLLRIVDCTTAVHNSGSFGLGWTYEPATRAFKEPSEVAVQQYQDDSGNTQTGTPEPVLGIPRQPNPRPLF